MQDLLPVAAADGRAIGFGEFTFDPVNHLLCRRGVEVPLPPRVLGVLVLLLERRGEVVTKQELISAVWREAFVSETSLSEAISVLRQTLGDDPQRPLYIQTLHRRGYRFIADIHVPEAVTAPEALPQTRVAEVASAAEREPRLSLLVPWLIALFSVLIAAVAVWRHAEATAPARLSPVQFTMALPAGLTVSAGGGPVAVSNDGSMIAFAGCDGGQCAIYVRPLSQTDPTPVAGTAGGASPFFSADGTSLGFFAGGRLQTIALGGGSPVVVADAAEPLGAVWLSDGQVVFARSSSEGLFVTGPGGGPVRSLTTPAPGEGGHRWPAALADASAVVFSVTADAAGGPRRYGALASMRSGTWARLLDDVSLVRVPATHYLVAQRSDGLVASWFDARTHSVVGLPVAVASPPLMDGIPQFAVNDTGTLVAASVDRHSIHVVLHWAGDLSRLVPAPQPTLPR